MSDLERSEGSIPERKIMDVCRACDHPLEADDRFCARCGAAVVGSDRTVALAVPAPSPAESSSVGPLPAGGAPSSGGASAPGVSGGASSGTALSSLESALRSDTSDAGRLVFAGFQRLCEGEVDDALLAAESALAMNSRLWSAHLITGVTRNQRGETEQAEAHLHDALQAEPMAIHHKATLERMLALATPRRFSLRRLRAPALSPTAWAAAVGTPLLLIGLIWAMGSVRSPRSFNRKHLSYRAVPPAGRSAMPALQPDSQPFPTPVPRSASPYVAPPSYTPPAPYTPPHAFTPPTATRPSAPPPLTPDEAPVLHSDTSRLADAGRPGALPRAGNGGPIYPLAPAQPDIDAVPELQVRRREAASPDTGAAGRTTAAPVDPTPWTKAPSSGRDRESAGFSLHGTSVGQARVGYEPSSRPNLPPPSDAVMSSAQVRPAPSPSSPPRRPEAASVRPSDQGAGDTARPDGRALQATARHLQSQGKAQEAEQAYRDAIAAYQGEIANGRDPRAAEYGIAASKAALDLLESSQ